MQMAMVAETDRGQRRFDIGEAKLTIDWGEPKDDSVQGLCC